MKTPIRIIDTDFNLYGEIDNYESLQIIRSWHNLGNLEMRINRYKEHVDKLQRNRILFPYNHLNKGYIIRHKEIELDERGKETENWIIRALPLKSWASQRLTYPTQNKMTDDVHDNAESVIFHYVNNNMVNPSDNDRKIPNLVLAENKNRGDKLKWSTRYEVLAEVIEEISLISGLGWNIEIDYENKQFLFVINEGNDLTTNQSELPPAIFSPEFGTLGQMSYMESDLNYKNFAIVEGPNKHDQDDIPEEEREKFVTEIGHADGYNRYEMLINANVDTDEDVNDERQPRPEIDIIADMEEDGRNELKENEQEIYVEGQSLTKSILIYEQDYNLGDIVTLQNKDWGVKMDARITEVKEIYEPNRYEIDLTFDNSFPTLIDKIRREIKR